MLRNVSLLPDTKNGKSTWKLLGPTGVPNEPFSVFAKSRSKKGSKRTLDSYCRNLAHFFDYIYEASSLLRAARGDFQITRGVLEDIIEAYDEYLVYGEDSGNEIAQIVARSMSSPRNSRTTSAIKHAPVREFLKLSDKIHQQRLELVKAGLMQLHEESLSALIPSNRQVTPSPSQRQAILGNSMMAGVIAGGTKLVPSALLPTVKPQGRYDNGRAFPFDRIKDFIVALPKHRDKAFYSFAAASGCRAHEGLQLLLDDIDVLSGKVLLIDPATRANCESYIYLTHAQRQCLAWKGRTTPVTMLIEPFATMFFEELEAYLKHEYVFHGLHRFVFQYLTKGYEGKPYFLSDADTRSELFHKTANACGISSSVKGAHSLRHAYGTYLLNYFPRVDGGRGLNIGLVQQIMGHAELKSTKKYAQNDPDLVEAEIRYANSMVFGRGIAKSLLQLKLEALNAQVSKVEAEIRLEQASRVVLM